MKKNLKAIILLAVLLTVLPISCKKSLSIKGLSLGWNGDHLYVTRVGGVWDRNTYYVDGSKNRLANLGKIPVSAFELRRQAEIFARTRAVFAFQQEMEEYFSDFDFSQLPDKSPIQKNGDISGSDAANNLSPDAPPPPTESKATSTGGTNLVNTNDMAAGDQEEFPLVSLQSLDEENAPPLPQFQKRKVINFREIYERVNLEITMLEKVFNDDNDVDIVYTFYGKNLKQELANAFRVSAETIELRK